MTTVNDFDQALRAMNDVHSLLSLMRHRHLPKGLDLEKDIDKALAGSEKFLKPWWQKEMGQNPESAVIGKQGDEIRILKVEIDAMQKAIDGIAPFCKAKSGMDDDAVGAIQSLAYRSGPRTDPPKVEEAPKRCTCSEALGEGCLTCGTPCPLHPNY